jgi:hypothetical protein
MTSSSGSSWMTNETWAGVIAGAVISIPIALATGLAIEPVRRWYASRGATKAEMEARRPKVPQNALAKWIEEHTRPVK